MKPTFILFFVLLGMLQYGILLSAWSAYRSNYRPASLKYWSLALGLSATSYLIFAGGLATSEELLSNSNFLISVGNTLIMASVLFQGLFARTLRSDISSRTVRLLVAIVIAYGIVFEVVRHYGTFESRTAIVGVIIFLIYVWQLVEISVTRKDIKSINLDALFWLVLVEAILILSRAVVVYLADANVQVLNQVPLVASLLLWIQLTLNILAYSIMVGYWVEEITKKNVAAEFENTKIKGLLEEKDHLLKNLVRAKKIAELGAMSASISHEINQPLAAIKLNAWSLKRTHKLEGNLTDIQSELVEQTVKDVDRVSDIVSTLRTVFKTWPTQVTTIEVGLFIDRLKPLIEAELGSRSIELHYDIPSSLRFNFNESELTLVLLNLVNNAAKAGAKTITIAASVEGGMMQLRVEDNGSGVPQALVSHLFEIAKETEANGLGLGLWLSRYIIERGNGSITFQPREPQGSVFTIILPIYK